METWWERFLGGLTGDFLDLPDGALAGQLVARIFVAAALGGLLGFERAQSGKAAGLRTHMLVCLAAAFFVLIPQQAGMSQDALSRVIQGVASGVGFLGAGAIIKHQADGLVHGLTTAAGLYFTTAIGVAAGLGKELTAILGTALALCVLGLFHRVDRWVQGGNPPTSAAPKRAEDSPPDGPA